MAYDQFSLIELISAYQDKVRIGEPCKEIETELRNRRIDLDEAKGMNVASLREASDLRAMDKRITGQKAARAVLRILVRFATLFILVYGIYYTLTVRE